MVGPGSFLKPKYIIRGGRGDEEEFSIDFGVIYMCLFGRLCGDFEKLQTANPDEAAIISTLMAFEKSYNSGDQKAVLDLFVDDARITFGDPRNKKVGTKEEYGRILPERFRAVGNLWISDPKIRIEGDMATVRTTVGSKFGEVPNYIFRLKKHGDKWLIVATEY